MNLSGWDLVFASRIDSVNAGLKAQGQKLIQSFNLQTPVVAQGSYGQWQIVPGGSGSIVDLGITLSAGSCHNGATVLALAGGVLTIKVALALLPQAGGGSQLKFNLNPDAVTFVSLTGVTGLGEIGATALGMALAADLCAHAQQVSFVLASVSPIGPGGPAWMSPTALAFAYVVPSGGAPVLALFAVTDGRSISGFPLDVDPALIGSDGVGMAISPALFMAHVFVPALAGSFHATPASFVLAQPTLVNNNGDIGLPGVSTAGETYSPVVHSLSAQLVDDRINVAVAGSCDMHMNITMSFNSASSINVGLAASGQLAFATLGTPSFSKDVDIPWYDHLLDIAGGLAELILDVTVPIIASSLSDGINTVANNSNITEFGTSLVGWAGGGGFKANHAQLAGCLLIQGTV